MKNPRKMVVGSLALATSFFIAVNPSENFRRVSTLNGWAPWIEEGNLTQRRLTQLSQRGSVAAAEWRSSLWTSQNKSTDMDVFRAEAEKVLKEVESGFEEYIAKHPGSLNGRLAYGEFLNDTGRQREAMTQWETARSQHPDNVVIWIHLANQYSHSGRIPKAIQYFESGLKLPGATAEHYRNYAVVTYLFRKDFKNTFGWNEDETYNHSIALYRKAISLEPSNYALICDYAMTFYAIRPRRCAEALEAWSMALKHSPNDIETQRVHLHMARFCIHSGDFSGARTHLDFVQSPVHSPQKQRVIKLMKETEQASVNSPQIADAKID